MSLLPPLLPLPLFQVLQAENRLLAAQPCGSVNTTWIPPTAAVAAFGAADAFEAVAVAWLSSSDVEVSKLVIFKGAGATFSHLQPYLRRLLKLSELEIR